MIKPTSYWALHKAADPYTLGRVGVALAGRVGELDPPLTAAEAALVAVVQQDSEWMDERLEEYRRKEAERKARYRKARAEGEGDDGQGGQPPCPAMSRHVPPCPAPIHPSIPPSLHPSIHPSVKNNRSRSRSARACARGTPQNGNGNGNGDDSRLDADLKAFVEEVRKDGDNGGEAFFDPRHDPAVMCIAVTRDVESRARWVQLAKQIPEGLMRQELFSFYREIRVGEEPNNRGAALNARLQKLVEAVGLSDGSRKNKKENAR